MFIIFVMKYLICFFLFIVTSAGFAKQNPLTLISPKSDFRSTKALVLFKGTVDSGSKVFINETPIPVYKNRFYIKAILSPHQENEFNIKTITKDNHEYYITRMIDYFPEQVETRTVPYTINSLQFQPLSQQWNIKGNASYVKDIYINGKHIPVNSNNQFQYRLSQESLNQSYVTISGISQDLLLFSHRIGLQNIRYHSEKKVQPRNADKYISVELGVLQAYYAMQWERIPFTTIQEKMIHDLIQSKYKQYHLNHIKLIKKGANIVVAVPYLHDSLPIPDLSYQLLLIMQNTLPQAQHISIVWYNQVPNILEVVYTNSNTPFCIIDDKAIDLDEAIILGVFSEFQSNHFGIR